VRISGSNAGYTMFQGSVKSTGYPLHSSVSPSLPLPCVTVFHHISAGLYQTFAFVIIIIIITIIIIIITAVIFVSFLAFVAAKQINKSSRPPTERFI
jgi:hypothetical protein